MFTHAATIRTIDRDANLVGQGIRPNGLIK